MKHILQPTKKTCGQTCLAMLCGITVEEACALIGKFPGHRHWKGTTTKQLQQGLRAYGISFREGKLRKLDKKKLPGRAILRLNFERGNGWHWVLLWDRVIYDPSFQEYLDRGFEGETLISARRKFLEMTLGRATSCLEILMPENYVPLPLHGSKTHPLSAKALAVLRALLAGPLPTQEANPGIVNRLLRTGQVELVDLPSPYKTRKGNIPHLKLKS